MVQTAYPLEMTSGLKGQLYDMSGYKQQSMNNPAIVIPYGQAVEKITGDEDGVKLPDNASAVLWGIGIKDNEENLDAYPVKSCVSVMTSGRMYVEVEEAVTPDDDVYVRYDGRAQVQTFVLDADIIAANVITVTVDGNVLTETYDGAAHLSTMNLFAAQIQAQASVATAVVGGAGNRTITITSVITVDAAVTVLTDEGITLGVSQAGIVVTETVVGIEYAARGKFRTDADTGTALAFTYARYVIGAASGENAVVEINLP